MLLLAGRLRDFILPILRAAGFSGGGSLETMTEV